MYDLLQLEQILPIGMRGDGDQILILAENTAPPPVRCEKCGHAPLYKHGKRRYTYADTPIHGKPVKVEIETRRYRCKACGTVVTLSSPSLDDKRVATRRLVQYVQDRCFETTFTWISKEVGLALNTLKGIAQDYATHLEEWVELETPRLLGMDELHILDKPRCVLVNLEMRSMVEMLASRTKAHLTDYFQKLKDRDRIEWVVIDMWKPYEVVIGQQLPDARIVIDRFHVLKEASSRLDELRKHLQARLSSEDRVRLKKYLRWSLLRGERKRTEKDLENIEYIKKHYPELYLALTIKEAFFSIYDAPNRAAGESLPGLEGFDSQRFQEILRASGQHGGSASQGHIQLFRMPHHQRLHRGHEWRHSSNESAGPWLFLRNPPGQVAVLPDHEGKRYSGDPHWRYQGHLAAGFNHGGSNREKLWNPYFNLGGHG